MKPAGAFIASAPFHISWPITNTALKIVMEEFGRAAIEDADRWDRKVIKAFVEHIAQTKHPGLTVDGWPEDDKEAISPIDAIAGRFAIEHVSIDTIDGQRGATSPFMQSIGDLEKEIKVSFNLQIFVRWGAIKKRQDYAATKDAIKRWIEEVSPTLPCGRHEIKNVSGVPFGFLVWKRDDLDSGIFVGRSASTDDSLSDRMKSTIERKAKKLKLWTDFTRVLVIESDDIALMNHVVFWEALKNAYPENLPSGVDQIWYADTCGKYGNYPLRFMRMTNDRCVLSVDELS